MFTVVRQGRHRARVGALNVLIEKHWTDADGYETKWLVSVTKAGTTISKTRFRTFSEARSFARFTIENTVNWA